MSVSDRLNARPAARRAAVGGLIAVGLLLLAPSLSPGAGPAKNGSKAVQHTRSYFGVLRRAHKPSDRLPQDRRAYWRQLKSKYGLAIGGARRAIDSHRGSVWLLPGAGWLCMDVLDKPLDVVIGGCQPTWKARRGLIALTQKFNSGKLIFTGALPDRSRHLRIVNSHHAPLHVRIADNTYRATYSAAQSRLWKPRRIVFLVGNHRHRFKLAGIRRKLMPA
jgi:hypothetical protein